MSISVLARQLISQEIFRGLSPFQLTEIVRQSERVVYRPGEYVIEAGATADAAVVIVAGNAIRFAEQASGQGAMQAQPLPVGSLLSELAMLVDHEHGATVVAHTTVRALRITREALQSQMLDDPLLADHFVERITERLSRVATELRLIDHAMATAEPAPA
jgi:CRP-like cAMP-binding protein